MVKAEESIYAIISGMSELYPEVSAGLPATAVRPAWDWTTFAFEAMTTYIFPVYNPLAQFQPNAENYSHYLEGMKQGAARAKEAYEKIQANVQRIHLKRARIKWAADEWRMFIFGTIVTGMVTTAVNLATFVLSGKAEAAMSVYSDLTDKFRDKEFMRDAQIAYARNSEGNPAVLLFYNSRIDVLKEQIKTGGDPTGELAAKITEYENSRDRLKN